MATPPPCGAAKGEGAKEAAVSKPFTCLELDFGLGAKMLAFALSRFHSTYVDDWNPGPMKSQVQSGTPGFSIPYSNKCNLKL